MPKKICSYFEDEAEQSDEDDESYDESEDIPGSLVDFIVEDGASQESDNPPLRDLDSLLDSVSTVSIEPNLKRKFKNSDLSDEDLLPPRKKAGRPKGSKNLSKKPKTNLTRLSQKSPSKKKSYQDADGREKPIGHRSFPLSNYSLTISRGSLDVPLDALEAIDDFLKRDTQKGGAATEVGARNNNLHIQSAFSIHYPKSPESAKVLAKYVRSLLPLGGKGYKIQCKPFSPGQTWEAMIGYITKDQGRQSYQIRTHNITPSVIYISIKLQYLHNYTLCSTGYC